MIFILKPDILIWFMDDKVIKVFCDKLLDRKLLKYKKQIMDSAPARSSKAMVVD